MTENEYTSFTLNGSAYPPRTHYKLRSFRGHPFCVSRPRYCPHCLASAGILLAHWDIHLTTACDVHHCYLLDECQECRRRGTLNNRKSVSHCCCGFDLRTAVTEPADSANIKVSTLVAFSFGTFLNAPRNPLYPHVPPFNDAVRFDDLLMSMEGLLGGWRYFGQTVGDSAEQIAEALHVFEPMLTVPRSDEIAWRWI